MLLVKGSSQKKKPYLILRITAMLFLEQKIKIYWSEDSKKFKKKN